MASTGKIFIDQRCKGKRGLKALLTEALRENYSKWFVRAICRSDLDLGEPVIDLDAVEGRRIPGVGADPFVEVHSFR